MDLNEKIAARRIELGAQAKEEEREAKELAEKQKIEDEEKSLLEIPKRLEEQALDLILQKALKKAALNRMTINDYWIPFFYLILSVLCGILINVLVAPILIWILVGPILIWLAVTAFTSKMAQHQKNIITEGDLLVATQRSECIEYLQNLENGSMNLKITRLPPLSFIRRALLLLCLFGFISLILAIYENSDLAHARAGDVIAMKNVAARYIKEEDINGGMKWLEKAADAGDAESQLALYILYRDNIIKPLPDDDAKTKAKEMIDKIAAGGNSEAQMQLGVWHIDYDISEKVAKAEELFEKAASGGNTHVLATLGRLNLGNDKLRRDYAKAVRYFNKAVIKDRTHAKDAIEELFKNENAPEWRDGIQQIATQGNVDAQIFLGFMFKEGVGISRDDSKASEWLEKSANHGSGIAEAPLNRLDGTNNSGPIK